MPARCLLTTGDVEALVEQLFAPSRRDPIVAVTVSSRANKPFIDVDKLAAHLDPVTVVVLPTQELTWELTSLLPDDLGVYGGATRIWWPGLTVHAQPHRHPLVFAFSPEEGLRAAQRIAEELDRHEIRSFLEPDAVAPRLNGPVPRPYPVGDVVVGMVMAATPGGAEVEIAPGVLGWLVRRRRDAEAVVGNPVRVRVAGYHDEGVVLEQPPRSPADTARKLPGAADHLSSVRPGPPRPQYHQLKVTRV